MEANDVTNIPSGRVQINHSQYNTSTPVPTRQEDRSRRISLSRIRSMLHAATAIVSMIVFGNISEICDALNECQMRYIIIISLEIAAMSCSVLCMFICCGFESGCNVWKFSKIEWILSIISGILHSISAGLISSIRTGLGNIISVSFSWVGVLISFITALLSMTTENGPYDSFFLVKSPNSNGDTQFSNVELESPAAQRERMGDGDNPYRQNSIETVSVPHHYDTSMHIERPQTQGMNLKQAEESEETPPSSKDADFPVDRHVVEVKL